MSVSIVHVCNELFVKSIELCAIPYRVALVTNRTHWRNRRHLERISFTTRSSHDLNLFRTVTMQLVSLCHYPCQRSLQLFTHLIISIWSSQALELHLQASSPQTNTTTSIYHWFQIFTEHVCILLLWQSSQNSSRVLPTPPLSRNLVIS